jgi:hypothetical protein
MLYANIAACQRQPEFVMGFFGIGLERDFLHQALVPLNANWATMRDGEWSTPASPWLNPNLDLGHV